MVAELVGDLLVDERQQPLALVDQSYPNAERGEDAGVFAADDAGPNDGQCPRQPIEIKNVVAGEDPFPVERNVRIARGFRAGGDDDLPSSEGARAGAVDILKANRVRRDERCCRRDNFHIIAHQLMAGHIELVLDHPVGAE